MLERLEKLEENVARLEAFRRTRSSDSIKNDTFEEWALRYGLFESIQIVIDIACHVSGKYNLGHAKSYAECIENLAAYGYLEKELARRLVAAVGLRNLLIHEYVAVDAEKLFGFLEHLDDFRAFVMQIKAAL